MRDRVFNDSLEEIRLDATVALEIEVVNRGGVVAEGEEPGNEFGEALEGPEVGGMED